VIATVCAGFVVLHTPVLFANVQRGRKKESLVSVLQDTLCCYVAGHILAIIKKGRLLKGGVVSTQVKMVLMMSKATHHVHY